MKDKIIKIGLVVLGSISLLIASFTSAEFITNTYSKTIYRNQNNFIYFSDYNNPDILCLQNINNCAGSWGIHLSPTDNTSSFGNLINNLNSTRPLVCAFPGEYFNIIPSNNSSCVINVIGFSAVEYTMAECKSEYDLIEQSECSVMSSLDCQTTYSLIPVSSVDSNYCQNNNLCPDVGNNGFSNLYINDIFHPGAFNIVVNIPEEIDRDYAYTNSGLNFNLDVVGYNQDTEYINSVIDVQSYKPTSEDFSKVFGLFSNYSGLLIACLFIILVFYFVKKLFK